MAIRRGPIPAVDHFTVVPNDWLRDERLSMRARGLLAYLLSHREGWEITGVRDLARRATEGREAMTSAVQELEVTGYLTRAQRRAQGGRLAGIDYVLTAPPPRDPQQPPVPGNPGTGAPVTGKPVPGNPATKKTTPKETTGVLPPNPPPAEGGADTEDFQGPEDHRGQHARCRPCGTTTRARQAKERRAASDAERAAAAARAAERAAEAALRGLTAEPGLRLRQLVAGERPQAVSTL